MKCIKKQDNIMRVSNEQALEMVNNQGWEYCPKKEWKEKIRK